MISRRVMAITALVLAGASLPVGALADAVMIREVEGLRKSVSPRDPSYRQVTLKLADLMFNHAKELESNPDQVPSEEEVNQLRRKALGLYHALMTQWHAERAPTEERIMIQFQMARLYSDMGEVSRARPIWNVLVKQSQVKDVQQEAALRLADLLEHDHANGAELTKANEYYLKAIDLCQGSEQCYYPHYRRGWLQYRLDHFDTAIQELTLSLWDGKGRARDEAVRDLLLFWSSRPTEGPAAGTEALHAFEKIAERTGRWTLLVDLADAFYATGNKVAGIRVLEESSHKVPDLRIQVRLLEEYYGIRDWAKFRSTLEKVATYPPRGKIAHGSESYEEEKIFRRLVVQLDGERIGQKAFAEDFRHAVVAYLKVFPWAEERTKMIDGWLASEPTDQEKFEYLQGWVDEAEARGDVAYELTLRKILVGVAQKLSKHEIVARHTAVLFEKNTDPKIKLEYRYFYARALYALSRLDEALPVFLEIADAKTGEYALKSQNLVLDIYNQKKQFALLVAQAEKWTLDPALNATTKGHDSLAEMSKVRDEAAFQWAVSLGKSPLALKTFFEFCEKGQFLPKSCENSKILAFQLGDREKLYSLLKRAKDDSGLAAEYEASGLFSEAAQLLEKDPSASDLRPAIKIALLYELAGKMPERLRVLTALRDRMMAKKPKSVATTTKTLSPEDEELFLFSILSAGLVHPGLLESPLSQSGKVRIASILEESGRGTPETKALVAGSAQNLGSSWAKYALAELHELEARQAARKFYGRDSKYLFHLRTKGLSKLVARADYYLPAAPTALRLVILKMVKGAYAAVANEIQSTPLPDGMTADALKEVHARLAEMAGPFEAKAKEYDSLARQQIDKVTVPTEHALLLARYEGVESESLEAAAVTPVAALSAPEATPSSAPFEDSTFKEAIESLHKNPADLDALEDLQKLFKKNGNTRLSAYYQGRILQTKEVRQ